jgi:uncharacterized protein (TIGR03067 family)
MQKVLKWLFVLAVVYCFAADSGLAAEDAQKKQGPRTPQARAKQMFAKLDADGDGQLTFDEFKGRRTKAPAIEKAEQVFKLMDKGGDGKLSLEEFANKPVEARLKTMDKDGDGKLSFEEFKGPRKTPQAIERAEQTFKRLDKDGDKQLTLEELKRQRPAGRARPDRQRIQGTWKVVAKNGDENTDEKGNECVYADGKLTIKATSGEQFEMKYEIDPSKKPRVVDFAGEYQGQQVALKGIYLLQGNKLTVCLSGPDQPRPTEFKAIEEQQSVWVLQRVRQKRQ